MLTGLKEALLQAFKRPRESVLEVGLVIAVLAVGVGACAILFGALSSVVSSVSSYRDPGNLVALWGALPSRDIAKWPTSPRLLSDIEQGAVRLDGVAGAYSFSEVFNYSRVLKVDGGDPETVDSVGLTWNLLSTLGVRVALGRDFEASDAAFVETEPRITSSIPGEHLNQPNAVLVSHAYWRERFNSAPSAIGRLLELDGHPVQIIGVLPAGFKLRMPNVPDRGYQVYEVVRADLSAIPRASTFLGVVARLAPATGIDQARQELDVTITRLLDEEPMLAAVGFKVNLFPLVEEINSGSTPLLLILGASVLLVVLVAGFNAANLLLARAVRRSSDTAMRMTLGSTVRRLVLAEGKLAVWLAVASAAAGLLLAWSFLRLLLTLDGADIPHLGDVSISAVVVVGAFLVNGLVACIACVLPVWLLSRSNDLAHLRQHGRGGEKALGRHWAKALVIGEIAITFIFFVLAAAIVVRYYEIKQRSPGFEPERVLVFNYALPSLWYPDLEQQLRFHRVFHERLVALPGVEHVGGINALPLTGGLLGSRYSSDLESFTDGRAGHAQYRIVYPGYFEAVGSSLLRGRWLDQTDQDLTANHVVVNQAMATELWPDADPIGRTVYIRGASAEPRETIVVGVVAHQDQFTVGEQPNAAIYLVNSFGAKIGLGTAIVWTLRRLVDASGASQQVREALQAMDSRIPLQSMYPLEEVVKRSTATERFAMRVVMVLCLAALLMAMAGLYGLLSRWVSERLVEFGVRRSVGATSKQIFSLVLVYGARLMAIGLLIGWAVLMLVRAIDFEQALNLDPGSGLLYGLVAIVFVVLIIASILLAAREAASHEPSSLLRR